MNQTTATETTYLTDQPPPHRVLTTWVWDEHPNYAEWRCSCSEVGSASWSKKTDTSSVDALVAKRHRAHVAEVT